jgi:phenylalanyl-tRNA synthetase beta chain
LDVTFSLAETRPDWADQKLAANILVKDKNIGSVLGLNSEISKSLGIKKKAAIAEISIKDFYRLIKERGEKQFKEYEKYPPVMRDLAFVVEEKILYNDIREEIENYHKFIKKVELFDVYQGRRLGKNKKNLAFHIVYQADKTLTAKEIDKLQQGLIKKLEKKFEAKIRDF